MSVVDQVWKWKKNKEIMEEYKNRIHKMNLAELSEEWKRQTASLRTGKR